ncbi:MAG TPA: metal ABC transporter substrate-binding protein [Phycisphaerales bacterium]|nr:metal ABC transporter substrate-binding protein [Phycisphaerales bacterium]
MLSRITIVFAIIAVGLGLACCSNKDQPAAPPPATKPWPAPMSVVVSIAPLKGLVEPLLPPGSSVTVLIPPGASEHGYEIPPARVKDAINADLLVWIGGMEPQVDTISRENRRPNRVDVRLADALKLHIHAHDHGHGKEEEHDHHGDDPHVWLDPVKAKEIVRAVAEAVMKLRTDDVGKHDAGAAASALEFKLGELDAELRAKLADAKGKTIVVAHDAYGWLARRYELKTVAISGLNAGEPKPADLQKAKEAVRTHGLRAVFTEPQLSDAAAKSIAAATGVKVLKLDPLGDGDYFKMMRENLAAIREALGLSK